MTELPLPVPAGTRHELVAVEPMTAGRGVWAYRGVRIVEHARITGDKAQQEAAYFTLDGHPHSGLPYSCVERARAAVDRWLDQGELLRGYVWPRNHPRPGASPAE